MSTDVQKRGEDFLSSLFIKLVVASLFLNDFCYNIDMTAGIPKPKIYKIEKFLSNEKPQTVRVHYAEYDMITAKETEQSINIELKKALEIKASGLLRLKSRHT